MARSTTTRSSAGFGRPDRLCGANRDDGGFTLLESVIAFGMFMIVLVSVSSLLVSTGRLTTITRDRTVAANLATEQIELMREQYANSQTVDLGGVKALHGINYTVSVGLSSAFTASCPAGSSRQVNVTVAWTGHDGPHAVRDDTVIAC